MYPKSLNWKVIAFKVGFKVRKSFFRTSIINHYVPSPVLVIGLWVLGSAVWILGRFSQREALIEDWRQEEGESQESLLFSPLRVASATAASSLSMVPVPTGHLPPGGTSFLGSVNTVSSIALQPKECFSAVANTWGVFYHPVWCVYSHHL